MELKYEKRKNTELFQAFQQKKYTFLSNIQNYIPIYKRFFELNETNYNSINLNHTWHLNTIKNHTFEEKNLFSCSLKNSKGDEKEKDVFFKMAPLLDPFKYIIGKYDITNENLFSLPKFDSTEEIINPKILNQNNSAYIDGFFSHLSSTLIHKYDFKHGVDYYGSFLATKNNFKINVIDDIEYICKSEFFNKNKNTLFEIDSYDHLFNKKSLKPLNISQSLKDDFSEPEEFPDDMFDDVFALDEKSEEPLEQAEQNMDLIDITNLDQLVEGNNTNSLHSTSTCSSRTSYTTEDSSEGDEEEELVADNRVTELDENEDNTVPKLVKHKKEKDEEEYSDSDDSSGMKSDISEEELYATIAQFPVQVICMEYCENTFDNLIMNSELNPEEWTSAFMQIIMILITYQKVFDFTHNDLHTNNVMYNKTSDEFLYYCYNKKYYKVPTFGRIFKIIDFGRAIYKYEEKVFCSDSFMKDEDAATQYNTEPYFNDKKPRLEPNYSFDLCRLACSIFDYVVDDLDEIKNLKKCEPYIRLIVEWCLDDNGLNVLYKTNGDERYPDFKLYKMIARSVHKHTPQNQLDRDLFKQYIISKKNIQKEKSVPIMNIDNIHK